MRRLSARVFSVVGATSSRRAFSGESKDLLVGGAPPLPPAIPQENVTPVDFNPHIEWYEFPKELWSPLWPYTSDECIRMCDDRWDSTADEMGKKYGWRICGAAPVFVYAYWIGQTITIIWELWYLHRSPTEHAPATIWRMAVREAPNSPKVTDDDVYLDQWLMPQTRQVYWRMDALWQWKPVVKDGKSMKLTLNPPPDTKHDVSEWVHMTSRY